MVSFSLLFFIVCACNYPWNPCQLSTFNFSLANNAWWLHKGKNNLPAVREFVDGVLTFHEFVSIYRPFWSFHINYLFLDESRVSTILNFATRLHTSGLGIQAMSNMCLLFFLANLSSECRVYSMNSSPVRSDIPQIQGISLFMSWEIHQKEWVQDLARSQSGRGWNKLALKKVLVAIDQA